jgi:hypothetical protein
LTTKSFEELKSLAFYGKSMGPEFFVIGGWAAWRYHSGLGSRDIDVVFHDHQIMDPFLAKYYKMNDYELYGGPFETRYRKRIGDDMFVQIDAASFADGQPFKEDRRRLAIWTAHESQRYMESWRIRNQNPQTRTPDTAESEGAQR